jgi:DNA-binding GntR family transcriptional regulator
MKPLVPTQHHLDVAPLSWAPVYQALREAIISHQVPPGTKLPEDELSSIYSVGRALIRPALQALAHDRLVRLEPNRGAFVAQPSKQEAREVFEARALIEPKVAALAAELATPAAVKELRLHLEREHAATRALDDAAAIKLSAGFHMAVADIASHSIFSGYVHELLSRSSLIVALYWKRRDATCQSHAHHALVDAIAEHKAEDAANLMKTHIIDLLSGLDLEVASRQGRTLSDMLRK